jgi:hypothetical protein
MANKKDENAELRARIEALEAAQPKPAPSHEDQARADAEWRDKMHQAAERRANTWMHPNAVQDLVAAEPKGFMAGVVHDNRAPSGRPGMIPSSQSSGSPARSAGDGTGWVALTPLSPPPGVAQADKLMDEQDRRDRIELARRLGRE